MIVSRSIVPEGSDWKDNLKKCGDLDSPLPEFWSVYNNPKPASKLPLGNNYHVFKKMATNPCEKIQPIRWEASLF
jgi:hypothetical protein